MYTRNEYTQLDWAYDFFNENIFNGILPDLVITYHRKKGKGGYYKPEQFEHRQGEEATDELALNTDAFTGRDDVYILSILVHEMVHCWQEHYGKPSRNGYHNKEWASMMESIGLMPSNTGEPGGKRTGQSMSHYVLEGGQFEQLAKNIIAQGFAFSWQSTKGQTKTKPKDKDTYTCPQCEVNAWGKLGLKLVCGECGAVMQPKDEQAIPEDEVPFIAQVKELLDNATQATEHAMQQPEPQPEPDFGAPEFEEYVICEPSGIVCDTSGATFVCRGLDGDGDYELFLSHEGYWFLVTPDDEDEDELSVTLLDDTAGVQMAISMARECGVSDKRLCDLMAKHMLPTQATA